MADKKVKLKDQLGRVVRLDDGASGATLGRNLYGPDGKLLTSDQIINPPASKPGPAATIWRLIREIPANIQKLAALIGRGFAIRRDDGEWALRTLQPGDGIDIANGDGEDGDPTISLEDLADSGAGALLAITRDGKGRVSGTRTATITGTSNQINVVNGNAAAGVPTLSLATAVMISLSKADSAVQSVVAGSGIAVNNADPRNPVVSLIAGGFGPPPTDGTPYVGLNGAWEQANAPGSRFWLVEYPLLTDQAGNQLTDQAGNFLMANSPIVPPGWPSSTVAPAALPQVLTLAQANALVNPTDGQYVLITDLSGGRELCWYDITAPGSTKWRRVSDRSIAN